MTSLDDPLALYALATSRRREGAMDLWRRTVDAALSLPHDSHQQIYARGTIKLLLDDWSGWLDRESRIFDPGAGYLASRSVRELRFSVRAWDGREAIEDKVLYVTADGGFGDCLQMLRYLPTLARRARRVVISVRPALAGLVRQAYGDSVSVTLHGADDVTKYDRYAWMLSLPALLGELPAFSPLPYWQPTDGERLDDRRVKIGVRWTGDAHSERDAERFLPLELLSPLLDREEWHWYSLQTGPVAVDQARLGIEEPPVPLHTFAQTAQLISQLDAVVTVDTAVAHLAGVLGVPTWLALPADADARWGLGPTTGWYPTLRLIRQQRAGDWTPVISALNGALEQCAWPTVA